MPPSPHSEGSRSVDLPPGCKDLIDAVRRRPIPDEDSQSLPPVVRVVILPESVAVRYVAELLQLDWMAAVEFFRRFEASGSFFRSMPFEEAARLLRSRGILAQRET